MTDKFTIRDMLVYTFLGFTAIIFYSLYDEKFILNIIVNLKDYTNLSILLLIPIFYLIGHIIMSVDDFIFNCILKKLYPKNECLSKYYNLVFFGFRNIGLRNQFKINDNDFFKACDKLVANDKDLYAKAEYYQVMSDLFKGILLIIFISCILDITDEKFEFWKYILFILLWYRARSFSSYYVRIIKRNIENPSK